MKTDFNARLLFASLLASASLVACSVAPDNSGLPEDKTLLATGEVDILSIEQYRPELPVVEADKLSSSKIAELEASKAAKLIKTHTFTNGKEYTYVTVGDLVVSGDMLISTEDKFIKTLEANEYLLSGEGQALTPQGAFLYNFARWPGGIVYWERGSLNNFNATQQQAILNSMQEITNKTDIGFVGDTGQAGRIRFVNATTSCASRIGRTGEVQLVELGDHCFGGVNDLSAIIHELGHAIGMIHEHSRPDRNDYIDPNESNLTTYGLQQFNPLPATIWNSYDYPSIMHYPRKTTNTKFVKNINLPMFTTPGYSGVVRSARLTPKDIQAINSAY